MPTPHKHAEVIKAWADGEQIQYRCSTLARWVDVAGGAPGWFTDFEYRVKPKKLPLCELVSDETYTKLLLKVLADQGSIIIKDKELLA